MPTKLKPLPAKTPDQWRAFIADLGDQAAEATTDLARLKAARRKLALRVRLGDPAARKTADALDIEITAAERIGDEIVEAAAQATTELGRAEAEVAAKAQREDAEACLALLDLQARNAATFDELAAGLVKCSENHAAITLALRERSPRPVSDRMVASPIKDSLATHFIPLHALLSVFDMPQGNARRPLAAQVAAAAGVHHAWAAGVLADRSTEAA